MNNHASILSAFTLTLLVSVSASAQQNEGVPGSPNATVTIDGRYLPPPPQKFQGEINLNAAQSKPAWPARVVPPKGAPNILLVMTDDVGFAAPSTSLIGRLGSSTFRLSAAAVSMSLTGSCFSSESAPRPFHHGIRGRGGTIFWSALPSDWRQVQADIRSHLIHRPARDIIPPLGGTRLSFYWI